MGRKSGLSAALAMIALIPAIRDTIGGEAFFQMHVGRGVSMNNVLLGAGVACVIAAIVGGGAKAFGVEIPVLRSVGRQAALGIVGIGFLAAAYVVGNGPAGPAGSKPDPAVTAYRQQVLAACRTAQGGASGNALFAAANNDGTFDRGRFITALQDQITASSSVWDDLWRQPVPNELRAEASTARQAANDAIAQSRAAVDKIPTQLPATFTIEDFAAYAGKLNAALQAPASRLEGALSALAGQPCGVPTPAASG
jgi:hypothetical protein